MAQESRAADLADLKRLIRALNEQQADYLLIGGYALYAHGYQRATVDIDLLFPKSRDVGERVKRALLALPDAAAGDIDPAWFEEGNTIRVADEFVVDLMFNACSESFESLRKFEEVIEVEGVPIRTINLEGPLKTKQTVRAKDAVDRLVIERALAKLAERNPQHPHHEATRKLSSVRFTRRRGAQFGQVLHRLLDIGLGEVARG